MSRPSLMPTGQNDTGSSVGEDLATQLDFLPSWVPVWAIDLAVSLLVIVLAWLVARILVRLFGRRIARHLERPSLTRVSLMAIRIGVYIFALLTLLRINGMDLGNIALSVTVFTAVVGVILAPIVGSIISGFFLLADQPYEIGDLIELADQERRGFVDDITLRYTKIFTLDNTFLVVPNAAMRERDVINFSAEDTRVRLTLDVVITYESDLAAARALMEESARKVEGVVSGGPDIRIGGARYTAKPDCLINEFGDHGIRLRLRFWVHDPYRLQVVQSVVQTNIWEAFEGDEVEIAYPHSHLIFDETSGQLQVGMDRAMGGDGAQGRAFESVHSADADAGEDGENSEN